MHSLTHSRSAIHATSFNDPSPPLLLPFFPPSLPPFSSPVFRSFQTQTRFLEAALKQNNVEGVDQATIDAQYETELQYLFLPHATVDRAAASVVLQPQGRALYSAFVNLGLPLDATTMQQAILREQLWRAGEILRVLFNVLGRTKEFGGLKELLRKCFVRIRYMMDESFDGVFQREKKNEDRFVGEEAGEGKAGEGKASDAAASSVLDAAVAVVGVIGVTEGVADLAVAEDEGTDDDWDAANSD